MRKRLGPGDDGDRLQFFKLAADDIRPFLVEDGFTGLNIPLPGTDPGAFQNRAPSGILTKLERAGRTCYKSENRITHVSAVPFLRNIIKQGHESVIEHQSITVRLTTSRGVLAEITASSIVVLRRIHKIL